MRTLTPSERRAFRAQAHSLHPVVAIGQHGLTPAVLHEIDVNLIAHELIKIRVFGDDRDAREALLARICSELDAAPVQHLGKIVTIWRPAPLPEPEPARERRDRGERTGATARSAKVAGAAKKSLGPRAGTGGAKVNRASRRGRSVIVQGETSGSAVNPRRRHAAGAQGTASSRQSPSPHGKAPSPHGKSASSRVGASGARRRRKAR